LGALAAEQALGEDFFFKRRFLGGSGGFGVRLLEPQLGQAQGEGDPLVGQAAELLEGGQLSFDLREIRATNELGRALALVNPAELIVRAMAARVFGVFAAAAGFAADIILEGEAAWTHVAEASQLAFDGMDALLELVQGSSYVHSDVIYRLSDKSTKNLRLLQNALNGAWCFYCGHGRSVPGARKLADAGPATPTSVRLAGTYKLQSHLLTRAANF